MSAKHNTLPLTPGNPKIGGRLPAALIATSAELPDCPMPSR
jgi:hypothetical protein